MSLFNDQRVSNDAHEKLAEEFVARTVKPGVFNLSTPAPVEKTAAETPEPEPIDPVTRGLRKLASTVDGLALLEKAKVFGRLSARLKVAEEVGDAGLIKKAEADFSEFIEASKFDPTAINCGPKG